MIRFSPVDYVFTGAGSQPITFAFYYPQKLNPGLIQKSLRETLIHFPLISSLMVRQGKKEYGFRISEDGLTFDIVESSLPFDNSQSIEQYILPVSSVLEQPLTKITLTQTPEGSVLSVSISHALVDGFSYFHFLSSWARICRHNRILNPDLNRETWYAFDNPKGKSISVEDITSNCGLFWEGKRPGYQKNPVQEERFFLPKIEVHSHLEDIRKEHPSLSLFENDIITAVLWKKYLTSWTDQGNNPMTHLTCPFDFRRIYRNIARNYLGCAICFSTVSADLNTLKEKTVGELAVMINRSIRRVNQEYVFTFLQTLANLRRQLGVSVFESLHLRHPKNGLIVTNLTRMPIRDLDFGTGTPRDFLAYVDVRGSAAILSAEDGFEVLVSNPSC